VLNRYDSEVVHYLQETGVLIRLEENLLMHRDVIRRAQDKVLQHIQEKAELRISELRDILGSSRKYVVPLAEYLDRIGFTKREGEVRVLGQERGRE
jgi:selenocysteine-specific elongation factor